MKGCAFSSGTFFHVSCPRGRRVPVHWKPICYGVFGTNPLKTTSYPGESARSQITIRSDSTMTGFGCCSAMLHSQGYLLLERKCIPCSGVSGREAVTSNYHHDDCRMFSQHSTNFVKRLPTCDLKRMTLICKASPNSYRRNPDFSRQNKGFSRGRNRQNQEREKTENHENSDILSSKDGPLPSISSNPRYQATATPGQREKEIVELFRKVQAQLRERAAIKEEKKIEASQQGQGEKGTVDSLLKLLRKHSVDQGRRSGSEEEHNTDQPERSNHFDDEQSSNFFGTNSIATEEDIQEPETVTNTRPVSKFQRRSPVPRVKFQPVFSAEDDAEKESSRMVAGKKERFSVEKDLEPVFFDEREEPFEDDLSDSSDNEDEVVEEIGEPSVVENPNLSSMKLTELRELAKSRGMKGYSKLKKVELVKLLEVM